MSILFRKRVRTSVVPPTWANLSKHGVSESARLGRLTVNTRGQARIRLGHGFSFRFKL